MIEVDLELMLFKVQRNRKIVKDSGLFLSRRVRVPAAPETGLRYYFKENIDEGPSFEVETLEFNIATGRYIAHYHRPVSDLDSQLEAAVTLYQSAGFAVAGEAEISGTYEGVEDLIPVTSAPPAGTK